MQPANEVETVDATAEVPQYRNSKQEMRHRQVPFHPASAGTLNYQRIPMCGHKFVPGHEPRHRNCESCWFTFFQVHGELTQSCDEVVNKLDIPALKQLKPGKFTKNFLKFMSTLAQWKEVAEAAKEKDGEGTTGAPGDDGNATTGEATE